MQVVVTPSKDVIERALRLGWKQEEVAEKKFVFEPSRRAGLCISMPFDNIIYVGTVTILKHKLKRNRVYAITYEGPMYGGDLIKDALKVLGRRRVRVFFHLPLGEEDKSFMPILLGTKDGTIALAPKVWDDDKQKFIDEETELLSNYIKTCTGRFKRGIIFGTL